MLYEYACANPDCNFQFDRFTPIVGDEPQPCPRCGRASPQIFSRPGPLVMKGPKWNA